MSAQTMATYVASSQRGLDRLPEPRQVEITVGSLLQQADTAARRAAHLVDRHRAESADIAMQTMRAYADLLESLSTVAGRVWGESMRTMPISGGTADQTVSSINDFVGQLERCARRDPQDAIESSVAAVALRAAARCVRLAGDVLSTARHPHGGWRSLDAEAFDDRAACEAVVGSVARLVVIIGPCAPYLQLQARAVGVEVPEIDRIAPDNSALLWSAQRLQRQLPSDGNALHFLRPVSYVIDQRDLAAEISCRIDRLRWSAWLQSTQPYVGTATLHAYAIFAQTMHDFRVDHLKVRHRPGHGTWLLASRCLVDLRTATAGNRTIVSDVVAIRRLLGQPRVVGNSAVMGELLPVVEKAIDGLPELATWNSESFAAAMHRDQVYLAASALSGAEVTDDPNLVRVKLAGGIVPASPQRLQAVLSAYAAAATARQD